MYIVNDIAYAGEPKKDLKIVAIKIIDDLYMLVKFSTGERRIFDLTPFLNYPAFKPLADRKIFDTAKIDHGVLTWLDGDIDISPEAVYKQSLAYNEELSA